MLLFQTEWNNGALAVMALVALVPIIVVFFVLRMFLCFIPAVDKFLTRTKAEQKSAYYLFYIALFVASGLLAYGGFYLYYSISGNGVLE